jgi:hypothetical protein
MPSEKQCAIAMSALRKLQGEGFSTDVNADAT